MSDMLAKTLGFQDAKTMLDSAAKAFGFRDNAERLQMEADIDMSSAENVAAFEQWKDSDGTKAGLDRLVKGVLH